MSIRARTALNRAGVETVEEAQGWTDEALLLLDGFGPGSLDRLRAWKRDDEQEGVVGMWHHLTIAERTTQLAEQILLSFVDKHGYAGSSVDFASRARSIANAFYAEETP